MDSTLSPLGEGKLRLVDEETGEVFQVVKKQKEIDGSETLVVTNSALHVDVTELKVRVTDKVRVRRNSKLFVLMMDAGLDLLGNQKVSQMDKSVFVQLLKHMRYGNAVQATLDGLSSSTGIKKPHVCTSLKRLKALGAIKDIEPDELVCNVPTYEVNPSMAYRGSFSDMMRKRSDDAIRDARAQVRAEMNQSKVS